MKVILKCWLFLVIIHVFHQGGQAEAKKGKHIICYHGTWSTYRPSLGKFDVSDIDPSLCTHLIYTFFGVEESGEMRIIDRYLDLEENYGRGNIRKFNQLKLQNPTLKTLAAIGGWNEGSRNFSIVAADPQRRQRFVRSVVSFVQRHGFNGFDLDWEYPGQRHSLKNNDRDNYVTLLRELHEGLSPFGFLLTAAVGSAEFSASLSYHISEISKYLDIINVMAYDLHGPWDETIGINAPLYEGPADTSELSKQMNVDAIMQYWVSQGAPREKLVIGVPFYGRSFTLADASKTEPGSPHIGPGIAGQYSQEPGVIGYNEMCEKLQNEKWTQLWEPHQQVPYAFRDQQWVGIESVRSIRLKTQYVLDNDYAGVMVWSIESDDFRGKCGDEKYPLLKTIRRVLIGSEDSKVTSGYTETQTIGSTETTASPMTHTTEGVSQSSSSRRPETTASSKTEVTEGASETSRTTLGSTTAAIPREPIKCERENVYKRDPHNCAVFYLCSNGQPNKFTCPHPLKFDMSISSCNYIDAVDCQQ